MNCVMARSEFQEHSCPREPAAYRLDSDFAIDPKRHSEARFRSPKYECSRPIFDLFPNLNLSRKRWSQPAPNEPVNFVRSQMSLTAAGATTVRDHSSIVAPEATILDAHSLGRGTL